MGARLWKIILGSSVIPFFILALLLWNPPVYASQFTPGSGPLMAVSGENVFLAQTTATDTSGYGDVLVSHFKADGSIVWARTISTTLNLRANAIACDRHGNVIVVAQFPLPFPTDGFHEPNPSVIAKFNSAGELVWVTDLSWTDHHVDLKGVATDFDGNVYVAGITWKWGLPSPDGGYDYWSLVYTAKFSSSGEPLWARRWNTQLEDQEVGALCLAIDGADLIVAGTVKNWTELRTDTLVLVCNTGDGAIQKKWAWGNPGLDMEPVAVAVTTAGDIYICCGSSYPSYDVYLLKYDKSGNRLMSQAWGTYDDQFPKAMNVEGDNIFVTGYSSLTPAAEGFVLWLALDTVAKQTGYRNADDNLDTQILSVLPISPERQLYYGKGPFSLHFRYQELAGETWYPPGQQWEPTTHEEENCALTGLGEPPGFQLGNFMSKQEFFNRMQEDGKFLGELVFNDAANAPVAMLVADVNTAQAAPVVVGFDASGSWNDYGAIIKYEWDFSLEDGADYADASGPSPKTTHTYVSPGTYTASVRVTGDNGSTATAIWIIFVD